MESINKPSLEGRKVVVFDLEIKNVIEPGVPGKGWRDFGHMGISVGVARDYESGDTRVFMDDNLAELAVLLEEADLIVGFNIIEFDLPLLYSTLNCAPKRDLAIYDLLAQSRIAYRKGFAKGMRLDDHLLGTFGPNSVKTESGADAPIFWQKRQLGRLISYCIADVARESMLFEHVYRHGWVSTPNFGKVNLADPLNFFRHAVPSSALDTLAPGGGPTPASLDAGAVL